MVDEQQILANEILISCVVQEAFLMLLVNKAQLLNAAL